MKLVRLSKRRAMVLAALAVAASLVLTMTSAGAAERKGSDQTRLILRLPDLALGYMNFDFSEGGDRPIFCSQLTHPEDTPPKLKRFILRFHPRGCIGAYYSLFTLPGQEPGPKLIGTGAMALGSDRAADAAWKMVPILLSRLLGDRPPREVDTDIELGDAARLFHATLPGEWKVLGLRTSILVWRTGNTLAVVETFGSKSGKDDRDAAQLAPLQQRHIENPTPYTGTERYDAEVPRSTIRRSTIRPGVFVAVQSPFGLHFAYPGGAYASYEQMEALLAGLAAHRLSLPAATARASAASRPRSGQSRSGFRRPARPSLRARPSSPGRCPRSRR